MPTTMRLDYFRLDAALADTFPTGAGFAVLLLRVLAAALAASSSSSSAATSSPLMTMARVPKMPLDAIRAATSGDP